MYARWRNILFVQRSYKVLLCHLILIIRVTDNIVLREYGV